MRSRISHLAKGRRMFGGVKIPGAGSPQPGVKGQSKGKRQGAWWRKEGEGWPGTFHL